MNKKKQDNRSSLITYLLFTLSVAVVVFYVGFMSGKVQGARSVVPIGEAIVNNQGDVSKTSVDAIDFKQFWEVWNLIKDSYVKQPVSEQDMFYGALQGMLNSLDDPYSIYLTPEMVLDFTAELDGKFSGIGAEIAKEDDVIVVVAPLEDSPAQKAGVLAGDKILAVNGETIRDLTIGEAVMMIRGEEGTDVVLTVLRDRAKETTDITVTRGEITVDSVKWKIRDDGIAVVNIYMFNDDTTPLFEKAVQEILTSDAKGLILDLRNDPGGLLTEAINVLGYWIGDDVAVVEKTKEDEKELNSAGASALASLSTVVLVNQGSASASEIVAGALQDYGFATLIGEKTFGKGSVQEFYSFPDESAIKMTIAEWLTPKRRSINKVGITPDITVEFTEEDYNAEKTPQFDKAIDFLTEER